MPVLIVVAFVQTQLTTGIVGFLLIVGTGLIIRSYLQAQSLTGCTDFSRDHHRDFDYFGVYCGGV